MDPTTAVSAIETGLTGIASQATDVILIIIPVALGIAGLVFVVRKALGWFKSMAK